MTNPILASIRLYPIKSLAGHSVRSAIVAPLGLVADRRWMIVDPEGRFVTQRKFPKMATIAVDLRDRGVVLEHRTLPALYVPFTPFPAMHDVRVWGRIVQVVDQGDEAAYWLSAVINSPVRLVSVPPAFEASPGRHLTCFADSHPLLVVNEASVDLLNQRLGARRQEPIDIGRFRPNLVLRGLPSFAEDRIVELSIGEVRIRLDKPCGRCSVVNIDQGSGKVSGDPLSALAGFRTNKGGKGITFGWYASFLEGFGEQLPAGADVDVVWREEIDTQPLIPTIHPTAAP